MPVITPAPGASPLYMAYAAKGLSSKKGVPGSNNICTRSRGSNLPRPTCLARAASPPPLATLWICKRKSSTAACMAAALAAASALRTCTCVWIKDIGILKSIQSPWPYLHRHRYTKWLNLFSVRALAKHGSKSPRYVHLMRRWDDPKHKHHHSHLLCHVAR